MNDFLKIDNNRLVLLSTNEFSYILHIIFFDLYNDYSNIKVRYYYYSFNSEKNSYFTKEIAAFIYNGFLTFTGTLLPPGGTEGNNYFPILLIFSYANGTDFEIDISPYFSDIENYDESNNLYNYLIQQMKIDNNIFGYEIVEKIKLVSIPDEIIFLNGIDNSPILNNDTIDINSKLKQNVNIIKNDNYYFLDYQFILKEPDYNIFYSSYLDKVLGDSIDLSEYFIPKIFYGRTNTLKFKLCHSFCKTCRIIGISNNNQKCESCLEKYSFFKEGNQNTECVPQGYFYNEEINQLIQCTNDNSKFYIDITTNETICFSNNNECPINLRDNKYIKLKYYDQESKECKYSPINPSSITTEKSKTNEEQIEASEIKNTDSNINNPKTSEMLDIITTNINKEESVNKEEKIIHNLSNEEINKKIDTELLKNYTTED